MDYTNFTIRSYQDNDLKEIIQLWKDCELIAPQNNPIRDIVRKLKVNPEWFLVGEVEGKIIATCMAGYDGHRGWIYYLAVNPLFHKKGYAKEIMKKVEQLLIDAGCPKINLQIRSTNKNVIEFYKHLGYKMDDVSSMGKRLEFDDPL